MHITFIVSYILRDQVPTKEAPTLVARKAFKEMFWVRDHRRARDAHQRAVAASSAMWQSAGACALQPSPNPMTKQVTAMDESLPDKTEHPAWQLFPKSITTAFTAPVQLRT